MIVDSQEPLPPVLVLTSLLPEGGYGSRYHLYGTIEAARGVARARSARWPYRIWLLSIATDDPHHLIGVYQDGWEYLPTAKNFDMVSIGHHDDPDLFTARHEL